MFRSTNKHKFIMLHFCISIFTNCGTSKKFCILVSPVLLNQFSISKFMSQCNRKERNLKLSQSPNFKQTNSILSLETHLKTRTESRGRRAEIQISQCQEPGPGSAWHTKEHPRAPRRPQCNCETVGFMHQEMHSPFLRNSHQNTKEEDRNKW
jgi:hypothetical protein